MLNQIIDRLEVDERLSGWQLRELDRRSTQLFLNKDREEGRRTVESLVYEVEVLLTRPAPKGRFEGGKVTGSARFNLDPAGLARFKEDLDAAVEAAGLVSNQAYAMTEVSGIVAKVDLSDPLIAAGAEAQVVEAADSLRSAASVEPGVRLVAGEFFADVTRTRYFNSQGVHCLFESTLLSGEFCLLAQGPQGESEVFRAFKRRRLKDLGLAGLVAGCAHQSRERITAGLPRSGSFDVVFSGEALDHLFSWCLTQASASARYNRLTQAELGTRLIDAAPGATPLTLHHNALIPWAVGSYKLDSTGSPGCRRVLIENGVLKSRHANARYAQYLKQAATGELGGVEVAAGKESAETLLKAGARPLYHLSDFSYFEPNGVTGEFSSEIRYGRELGQGGARAIKGGSVSGLSQASLVTARFSSEIEQRERYLGPAY
ncbi:MAG: metallopeptidase TldD-related protein, partial [bacterium]